MKNELIPNPSLVLENGTAPSNSNTPSLSLERGLGGEFTYRDPSEMKDSGVEWIGMIPKDWEISRMTKHIESIVDYRGKTPEKSDEGIFLVTARNIKNGIIDYSLSQEFIKKDDYLEVMRRGKPEIGDVLFTTEAPLGEVANVDNENIALAQRVIKFRGNKNELNNFFLKYWILSKNFQNDLQTFATGSTALGIKASKLNQLSLILCSIEEQTAIANFLDRKTAEFDNIIAKKEKIITKLEEAKKSLISEVVTGKSELIPNPSLVLEKGTAPSSSNTPSISLERGLGGEFIQPRNPSEMKDSGVEWIGMIPKGWEVKRLKHLSKILFSNVDKKSFEDEEEVLLCNYVDVYKNNYITKNLEFMKATATNYEIEKFKIDKGDVIVTKDSETPEDIANSAFVAEDLEGVICGYHLALIKPQKIIGSYLHRLFNSIDFQKRFVISAKGVTRFGLSQSSFNNIETLCPTLSEQKAIANFLDRKTAEFDKLIEKEKKIIEKIKEAKQSLISEAVTGKIKVL